jgi:glycosyltransferase involved in cell wall biosynthesis
MNPCKKGEGGQPCGRVRITGGKAEPYTYGVDCAVCFTYATDAAQNAAWSGTGPIAEAPPPMTRTAPAPRAADEPPPAPCRFDGGAVPHQERERLQIGHLKLWRYCDHVKKPLGNRIVCPCAGCGPSCPGYKAEGDDMEDDPAPTSKKVGVPSVDEVLKASASDKHRLHGYGPLYAEVTRGRAIRAVLEIGVLEGDSVRAWAAAWPEAEIVAADNDATAAERIRDVPQARFVRLDVRDQAALVRFAAAHRNHFDLIIDDSTHRATDQLAIRRHLRQALRPGGVMVIEDVANDAAVKALRGRVWDFRRVGRWDSRGVTVERSTTPRALFSGNYLERDGAPILFANLARFLRGWDVVVHSPSDGPLRAVLEEGGIPVVVGDLPKHELADADLVVANTIVACTAVEQAKQLGVPCVWLIHESDPAMCGPKILENVRRLIDSPARVMFPCKATAEAYRDMPEHRAAIIPTVIPPVPVRSRQPASHVGGFIVASFGRDEPRKGQQDIREAVRDLPVALVTVSRERNPHEVLQLADLYVCSSRVEAYPLSLQEAKAYGLPVITTPVFGCAEIIRDGIDGLHYQPGDVQDLRAKIEAVRTDSALRARLSRPLTHLPRYAETLGHYEAAFAGAAGLPHGQPLHVVYHVAGMGPHWKPIVREQLASLARVGLHQVLATHVGEGEGWLIAEAARQGLHLTVCEHHDDVKQFECPAIRLVERLGRSSDRPVLYLHAKGISHDPATEPEYHAWRRLMMRELVERWFEHLPRLETHDAVGVNWWRRKDHFSGNFWLVRPSWLRRLPRFDTYYRDRFSCERWIGAERGCRAHSLVCMDKKFWADDRGLLPTS